MVRELNSERRVYTPHISPLGLVGFLQYNGDHLEVVPLHFPSYKWAALRRTRII